MARSAFDSEARRQIGARLKELRGGRSQAEFASELGVGRVALSNYEGGRRTPSSSILEAYARVGGVSVPWILTGVDPAEVHRRMDAEEAALGRWLAVCRSSGVIPKALVSDDELALLKVLRGLRMDHAVAIVRSILAFYDRHPAHKNGYVNRHADRLRQLVAAQDAPESGIDLDGLLEGYTIVSKNRDRPPRRKG